MNLRLLSEITKLKELGLKIRFLPKEEALNQTSGVIVVLNDGMPIGVYIPFSEAKNIVEILKKILNEKKC